MKRRAFLGAALGGLSISLEGGFFAQALAASALPGAPASDGRVFVLLNLQGGNDGLNMLVPHGFDDYYRLRPSLAIPRGDVLPLNAQLGFNPVLRTLKGLYDSGKVAVVQGVGYPKPDHSHFRSTEIWQTAVPDHFERTGWLGRYLDSAGLPRENLFNAVALAPVLPEALVANKIDVPAIAALHGYDLASDRRGPMRAAFRSLAEDRERPPFASPYLAKISELEDHAQRGSEELPKLIAGYQPAGTYPSTALGRSLSLAAQIIGSSIGTRVIYVSHGSFDTHAYQRATQDRLLRELSDALGAFYADLAAHGNERRVLTMTFSEFGRRVAENASRGTDHGEAAPLFLVGPVRGGVYGEMPAFESLDRGDLTFTNDFRSVYATVVERWFGRDSAGVLGGRFPTLGMLG